MAEFEGKRRNGALFAALSAYQLIRSHVQLGAVDALVGQQLREDNRSGESCSASEEVFIDFDGE